MTLYGASAIVEINNNPSNNTGVNQSNPVVRVGAI